MAEWKVSQTLVAKIRKQILYNGLSRCTWGLAVIYTRCVDHIRQVSIVLASLIITECPYAQQLCPYTLYIRIRGCATQIIQRIEKLVDTCHGLIHAIIKLVCHRVSAEAPEVINSVYIAVLTRVAPISVILSVTFHQVVVLAL